MRRPGTTVCGYDRTVSGASRGGRSPLSCPDRSDDPVSRDMIEKVRDTDSLLHRLKAGQPLEIGQQNDPDSSDIGAAAAHFREF